MVLSEGPPSSDRWLRWLAGGCLRNGNQENPLNNRDPNGLYTCDSSGKDGQKNCDAVEAGLARAAYKKMAAGKDKDRLGKSIDLYGKAGDKNGVNVKFDPNVYGGTLLEEDGSLTVTLYSEFTVVGQSYDGAVTRDVQAGVLAHE